MSQRIRYRSHFSQNISAGLFESGAANGIANRVRMYLGELKLAERSQWSTAFLLGRGKNTVQIE
jgi:hypothetical protein